MAVSLSVTTEKASMPVAFRLYLPEVWIKDRQRRKKTGVPDESSFRPSRRSHWSRFDGRGNEASLREWCWPMPVMETTPVFARR